MVSVGLLVGFKAKPGKEDEVESFLEGGLAAVLDEPATTAWFAVRISESEFAIFDAFPDDSGRQAHLNGRVAEAVMARADELFSEPPDIRPVDVIASKMPG
jgi:quinol monooxygenase YgiN